uniref:Uncharacterized protein n=1 Tax=Octopus bimaculoides TaxID=37653 RepID=A0A0L8FPX4_OCTBM
MPKKKKKFLGVSSHPSWFFARFRKQSSFEICFKLSKKKKQNLSINHKTFLKIEHSTLTFLFSIPV